MAVPDAGESVRRARRSAFSAERRAPSSRCRFIPDSHKNARRWMDPTGDNRHVFSMDLLKFITYENTEADYDELPEITDAQFASVRARDGGKQRGRPPLGSGPKQQVTLRLDPEIQARFRSSKPGWQARMNAFPLHNEIVLKMIVEFDDFIRNMEELLQQLREGQNKTEFEPVETSMAKVERNIGNTKDTVRNLRKQLAWEPVS